MVNPLNKNIRSLSADVCLQVIEKGNSLSAVLSSMQKGINDKDRALMQEICFGIMRVLPELNFYVSALMDKVLTGKNRILHYLLLVGIYQILYTRIPVHAAVSESVNGANAFKKSQFRGLINGVLREFLRIQEPLKQKFKLNTSHATLHPSWLVKRIQIAYPNQWQDIILANNEKPPMWLRVNLNQYTTENYRQLLSHHSIIAETDSYIPTALKVIHPINVSQLPFFNDGAVTVQDLSAQYAALLLAPKNGEVILDLCAAPGGKTTHILEVAPQAQVVAVDIDENRIKRINENLARLKLDAEVIVGDGLTPEKWCQSRIFDRILLDAPCSATGVIRRHPDIKWLRRDADIEALVSLQKSILHAIWSYLKPGGTLVYATCSILPDENTEQIKLFLKQVDNAILYGDMIQLLPNNNKGDGFFYAILKKLSNE